MASLLVHTIWVSTLIATITGGFSCAPTPSESFPHQPMQEQIEHSLRHSWFSQKVLASRIISDMETPAEWTASLPGSISFTTDRHMDGSHALRFETPFNDTAWIRQNAEKNGTFDGTVSYSSRAVLTFKKPQDWSDYNRIACWVYVHPESEGTQRYFCMDFTCQNIPTSPLTTPKYSTYEMNLTPGQWNYVVWEIPNFVRNKVTQFVFRQISVGHPTGKDGTTVYDIDRLELQRVEMAKKEGWDVLPGKISYCHSGYTPEQDKVAVAGGNGASHFQLFNTSGAVVLTKPVQTLHNTQGDFRLLDFSEVRMPGEYSLSIDGCVSHPFMIADTCRRGAIMKALNFYYVQRCGYAVPGVHDVCHRDWQGIHDGQKKSINGGWHDAGDMCQGAYQTGFSIYAMLALYEQLAMRGTDPELTDRALEEAQWGLDWFLKTRFNDGYRMRWSTMRIYTDNIPGTIDDVITPASNEPWINFLGAGIEAYAYHVLKTTRPVLARACLKAAQEDWRAAETALKPEWMDNTSRSLIWSQQDPVMIASWGAIASLYLYQATGNNDFGAKAAAFGRVLLACQQTEFPEGIPITGFFYRSPARQSIVHWYHEAFEESPILALRTLCELLPHHDDWIEWYGAALLHSEYFLKRGAEYSTPYQVLPSSIYKRDEVINPDPPGGSANTARGAYTIDPAGLLRQFDEGIVLSKDFVLRRFPIQVHIQRHGSTAVQLSEAVALSQASRLRNDPVGTALAERQAEWVLGANPFSQSLMYGEGYDYAPLFAKSTGNIVGALPVGMDCMSNDAPYWYSTNIMTPKEIWVVSGSRFLWTMAQAGLPALVQGDAKGRDNRTVVFSDSKTDTQFDVPVQNGRFRSVLPTGVYTLHSGDQKKNMHLISGGNYSVVLDDTRSFEFTARIAQTPAGADNVHIEIVAEGRGTHELEIRIFNGSVPDSRKAIGFDRGGRQTAEWQLRVENRNMPWVAVIIPDGDPAGKQELHGTTADPAK